MNTLVRFLTQATAVTVLALVAVVASAAELTTQDYIDIEQLYATYNHAIDAGDGEAWAATFTPDGTFNRFAGKDALVGFIRTWREKMNGATRRHWNSNLSITPSADGANGKVMLMLLDVGTTPPAIASTGQYTDVLVKTPAGWRFKSRQVKGDAPPKP
ncbi:nuclear transport factor 2 family protein [Steroidobacter sp.]|uniref:nuclear transport factor 2 family protein n=1 Tax=Steroidobacter sp. TaxID=1978227 RepID=UPI001A3A11E4|nr:nuclear transport factor 2 family protein [Steroidobacter sp.]MBL8267225.1 nuclear transport factor 2 family protein [Steroidobacter sp.]